MAGVEADGGSRGWAPGQPGPPGPGAARAHALPDMAPTHPCPLPSSPRVQAKQEGNAARMMQAQYARLAADKAAGEAAMEAAIQAKGAEQQRLVLALEAAQLQVCVGTKPGRAAGWPGHRGFRCWGGRCSQLQQLQPAQLGALAAPSSTAATLFLLDPPLPAPPPPRLPSRTTSWRRCWRLLRRRAGSWWRPRSLLRAACWRRCARSWRPRSSAWSRSGASTRRGSRRARSGSRWAPGACRGRAGAGPAGRRSAPCTARRGRLVGRAVGVPDARPAARVPAAGP
jgi:hypothetical protein